MSHQKRPIRSNGPGVCFAGGQGNVGLWIAWESLRSSQADELAGKRSEFPDYGSKIAEAMTVVQIPSLWPSADWVMLNVLTILPLIL